MIFEQQYTCTPITPTIAEIAALVLWCRYEVLCDAFDDVHCAVRSVYGVAMPQFPDEWAEVTKFARDCERIVYDIAQELEISRNTLLDAKIHMHTRSIYEIRLIAEKVLPHER